MRPKSMVLLVLALGCGLVASIGITQVLAKRRGGPAATGETETIFVAMKEVAVGEPLTPQDVRIEQWPKDKIPPGALTRIEDIEGRRTKGMIIPGEPILEKKLFGKGDKDQGALSLIPKGYRVVSVRVDEVSGGGALLQPGDRVDLLLYLAQNLSKGIPKTTTRTILQDIKVFAVNDEYQLRSGSKSEKKVVARTIRLLVTPSQAEVVSLATELGKIGLVLRSPLEDEHVQTPGASPSDLFGTAGAGNRQKEHLIDEPALGSSQDGTSFQDLLKEMRAKGSADQAASPVAGIPKPTNRWRMVQITGEEVSEVVLEETAGTDQDQTSDIGRWMPSGAASGFDLHPARQTPEVDAPAAEEEQQPEEEEEEEEKEQKKE